MQSPVNTKIGNHVDFVQVFLSYAPLSNCKITYPFLHNYLSFMQSQRPDLFDFYFSPTSLSPHSEDIQHVLYVLQSAKCIQCHEAYITTHFEDQAFPLWMSARDGLFLLNHAKKFHEIISENSDESMVKKDVKN